MDFFLFFISIVLSLVGCILDNYTTRIFIKDLGLEFEANKLVRSIIRKYGYKSSLVQEVILVVIIGFIDSIKSLSFYGFFGLFYLIVKGLSAAHNLEIIYEYRTIGISEFKERAEQRRKALRNVPLLSRIKLRLSDFVEVLICLIAYKILLTVVFPLVILIRSLLFGLASYLIIRLIIQ